MRWRQYLVGLKILAVLAETDQVPTLMGVSLVLEVLASALFVFLQWIFSVVYLEHLVLLLDHSRVKQVQLLQFSVLLL